MKTKIKSEIVARIQFCPRGGQNGYYMTQNQLAKFAKSIGKKYADHVIPIPNRVEGKCNADHDSPDNMIYWETNTGSHGWCCGVCGEVLQWG